MVDEAVHTRQFARISESTGLDDCFNEKYGLGILHFGANSVDNADEVSLLLSERSIIGHGPDDNQIILLQVNLFLKRIEVEVSEVLGWLALLQICFFTMLDGSHLWNDLLLELVEKTDRVASHVVVGAVEGAIALRFSVY